MSFGTLLEAEFIGKRAHSCATGSTAKFFDFAFVEATKGIGMRLTSLDPGTGSTVRAAWFPT